MKKFTLKFGLALLLLASLLFHGLSTPLTPIAPVSAIPAESPTDNPADDQPADAVPDDSDTPVEGTTDPENPNDTTGTEDSEDTSESEDTEDSEEPVDICQEQAGSLSWIICPVTNTVAVVVDSLYGFISEQLEVAPISADSSSPIYRVWQYMRDLTNIVFIIFIVIVIYSQLTGVGLNNYGVKRVLPRLIIAVILVNLSFIICSLFVDISNVIGGSLISFFENIQNDILAGASIDASQISWVEVTGSIIGGIGIAGIGVVAAGGLGAVFWMLVLALVGALISVAIGLITIGLRQGLISILIMISPLAFVAYLLPNTEKWFDKWKNLLSRMLIFYPMFSFLFGAARLVGWTLILSATSMFGIVVGLALQVLPLFLAISLLKMSGTILGAVSSGLNRLFNPVRGSLTGWAASRAEQRRQNYLAKNTMPGAKLRNYLAYRQGLRELDTKNASEVVKSRANARALTRASSSHGRNADGHDTYHTRPNRYTRTAKQASLYSTRLGAASAAYQNTLSEYGDHFHDQAAQRLAHASAEAYLDVMKEQFRSVNNAQADQDFLLNKYLSASTNRYKKPYEFNRLILGASGSLSPHIGESSILGQVISKSAEIEARRRREANIIMTKFGVDKPTSRAMIFDCASIDDDGFETDENGKAIEDSNYRIKPGKQHRQWDKFIGVHKQTNREITADEYNRLSAEERKNYTRVRYFDIVDDNGDPVSRVYSDEAGYMKELIRRDIAIGDPINRRYNISYGVADPNAPADDPAHNSTGLLRKYHSTISGAMLETKYKEHAAEVTPMLTAQADNGYITTIGQYNIANLDSLTKAAKPGSFLQNDSYAINSWIKMLRSVTSDVEGERFEDLFPDADIANYRNVNGLHLKGMRLDHDDDGNPIWKTIDRDDPSLTLEDQKNFVKHSIIPKAAIKLAGMINRNISPTVLDNMKPDGMETLRKLVAALSAVGLENVDDSVDFTDKLNPDPDYAIFKSQDPSILRRELAHAKDLIDGRLNRNSPTSNIDLGTDTIPDTPTSEHHSSHSNSNLSDAMMEVSSSLARLGAQLRRNQDYADLETPDRLRDNIDDIFTTPISFDDVTTNLTNLISNHPTLSAHLDELQQLIDEYRYADYPTSSTDSIDQITHQAEQEQARLEALHQAILDFLDRYFSEY